MRQTMKTYEVEGVLTLANGVEICEKFTVETYGDETSAKEYWFEKLADQPTMTEEKFAYITENIVTETWHIDMWEDEGDWQEENYTDAVLRGI
jgi:hypothetical protein